MEATASLPSIIPLPDDFQPEGIASGHADAFYVGSLRDGRIYKGSFRTGEGSILVPGTPGSLAVGLDLDERSNLLWVAESSGRGAKVYDGETGALIADFNFNGGFRTLTLGGDFTFVPDAFNGNGIEAIPGEVPTLFPPPSPPSGQPSRG